MQDYAQEGLRTLVLAKKDLTLEEYAQWAEEHHQARLGPLLLALIPGLPALVQRRPRNLG